MTSLVVAAILAAAALAPPAASAGSGYRQDEAARIAAYAVETNRDLELFFHDKARKPNSAQSREIDRAINSFAQEDPSVRREARIAALLRGASAVKSLLAELDKNETTAVNAIIVLADRGEKEALEPFRKALADKKSGEGVRLMAALALGRMGDEASVPALRSLLQENRHPDARAAAALALARLRATAAAKDLREVAEREDSPKTRSWAILAIGLMGEADPAGASFVVDVAKSKTESDRRAAALAIGLLAPEAGLAALVKLARDEEDLVRAAAAAGLSRYRGKPEAKAALLALQKDKSHEARAAAIGALAALGENEAAEAARKRLGDPQEREIVRRASARALGTLGGGGQEGLLALAAALGDGDDAVRSTAAVALARAGDKSAVAEIEKRLPLERKEFVRADFVLALAALLGKDVASRIEKLPDRADAPAAVLARGLAPLLAEKDAPGAGDLVARLLAAAALREGIGADEDLFAAVNAELLRAFAILDKNLEVSRGREGQRSQAPPVKHLQDLRVWFEDRPYVGAPAR